MHDSWPTKLMRILLTPRTIAWILVLAGIVCFIYMSPKTPIEFFDANARDEAAIQAWKMEKTTSSDRVCAATSRQDALMSCIHRMERISLLYDIANNPQRVDSAKSEIIDGFYSADEPTKAILRDDNESYRAAELELKRYRKSILGDGPAQPTGNRKDPSTEGKLFEVAIFRMQLEASLLRKFQARLFWRSAQ